MDITDSLEALKNSEELKRLSNLPAPQLKKLEEVGEKGHRILRNIKRIALLRKRIDDSPNIFRIIESRKEEDEVGDFLSCLLDPDEAYFFDDYFLRMFFKTLCDKRQEEYRSLQNLEFGDASVKLRPSIDGGEPDLIVKVPREDSGVFGVIIENKFGADDEKLPKYREYAEEEFEDGRFLVFLTINGKEPQNEEEEHKSEWIRLSHKKDIVKMLEKLMTEREPEGEIPFRLTKQFKDYLEVRSLEKEH